MIKVLDLEEAVELLGTDIFIVTHADGTSEAITAETLFKDGGKVIALTQAEYQDLEEIKRDAIYVITDRNIPGVKVDQVFKPDSENPQSGVAVNNALTEYSKNIYNFDEEVIIGYVIQNGVKKPLYRKAISGTQVISNAVIYTDNSIEHLYNVSGHAQPQNANENIEVNFNGYWSNSWIGISLDKSSGSVINVSNQTIKNFVLFIDYTKK